MEDRFWEPVTELEVMALDTDCNPMKDDPEEPQKYGCTVIGFNLDDPECCRSICTITGEDDRAEDESFAKKIVFCLQNIGECPKCGTPASRSGSSTIRLEPKTSWYFTPAAAAADL